MSATTAFATSLLAKAFTGVEDTLYTAWESATNLYISLHTSNPGAAGSQTTGEAAYTGYGRVSVAKTTSGWTVTGATSENDGVLSFGQCTASPGSNLTHVGIGLDASGTGTLLLFGELDTPIAMQVGATPQFAVSALETVVT
jgi:hypothetical protein